MARRGHDYRAILGHYYGGATLQKITYAPPALAVLPRIAPLDPLDPLVPIDPPPIAAPGAAR